MNPLFECYCQYCDSLISGAEYCPLGIYPIFWFLIFLTGLYTIYLFSTSKKD